MTKGDNKSVSELLNAYAEHGKDGRMIPVLFLES